MENESDKTFKQLVSSWVKYKKSKGRFNYSDLSDKIGAYWKEQLGDLYDQFYADVDLDVSIGLGWIALYVSAAKRIKEILDANPTFKIKIVQVKEKFGDLRIYMNKWSEGIESDPSGDKLLDPSHAALSDAVDAIVVEAEEIADRTCETCGKPGAKVSPTGWIHVACKKHSRL